MGVIKALDLFAGPGGWDEGIKHLGFDVLGIEWDKSAAETAMKAGHARMVADVAELEPADFGPVSLLIASPPCQSYSPAGKQTGRIHDVNPLLEQVRSIRTYSDVVAVIADQKGKLKDPRSVLVLEPLRYALRLTPSFIALEQVPTVLPIWEAVADVLRAVGYSVDVGYVHSEQFGVPQTRKRAYLVAAAPWTGRLAVLPEPTHSRYHSRKPSRLDEGVLPWVSMAEALAGTFPEPGEDHMEAGAVQMVAGNQAHAARRDFNHPAPTAAYGHNVTNHRFVPIMANSGDPVENADWVYRRPGMTVVGSFRPDVQNGPGYRKAGDGPRQKAPGSVQITKEQGSILQSFPADYPWQGSESAKWRQIGDAVPPLVARAVIEGLLGRCDGK